MDEEELAARLVRNFDYPEKAARVVAEDLLKMEPTIRSALVDYLDIGTLPAMEISGYSMARLIEEHGMRPPAAFLTLDWLFREPAAAVASLRRGHDRVVVDLGAVELSPPDSRDT